MNVVLFYQHIGRELFSIKKLAGFLESPDNKVFIYSIDFELDVAIKTAKKNKIDIIVSPWLYHDKNYEQFIPFIKLNPEVKLINLHSEQIFSPFSRIAVMPAKGVASDCVFHFCWSQSFKNALIEDGVDEKLCYITGNMRNDEAFVVKYSRLELAKRYNLDDKKKWLLFAENRNFVYSTQSNDASFREKGVDEAEIKNRMAFYRKTLQGTIKDLNHLPESFFQEYELIYRAHPGFQGNMGITNSSIREISELSVYEWLKVSDACIVWNSTVAFESDIMHVPVFVCSSIPVLDIYQTIGLKEYPFISSVNEITKYELDKVLAYQDKNKNYRLYFGEVDGHATRKVADAILEVYKNAGNYSAKLIPVKKYYRIRKWLFIKVLRFLVAIHLFELLKYPRSAYQQKKDIPYLFSNSR